MSDKGMLKEMYRSSKYLLEQNYVFESGNDVIAKHFIKDYFGIENTFKLSHEELVDEFKKKYPGYTIMGTEYNKFYDEICKAYMRIEKEPRSIYFKYLNKAFEDIKEIDENIKHCKDEIQKEILKEKQDQYYIRKMNHFIEINQGEKEKIIKFLIYDIKIKVLNESRANNKIFVSMFNNPYGYYLFPKGYDPKLPHSVEVKFWNLSIKGVDDICSLYLSDIEQYHQLLEEYITKNDIINNLLKSIKSQYYLKDRISIIDTAIDCYANKNFPVFINLVAIQIEGLFFEYCKALGINDMENKDYTLVEKINKIREKYFLYGYEYFEFDFPKIRNRIAHGKLLSSNELSITANELLLDLNYLVNIFFNKDLPLNKLVNMLNNFSAQNTNVDEVAGYLIDGTSNEVLFKYLLDNSFEDIIKFYNIVCCIIK